MVSLWDSIPMLSFHDRIGIHPTKQQALGVMPS